MPRLSVWTTSLGLRHASMERAYVGHAPAELALPDGHPTALAHTLAARALADELERFFAQHPARAPAR